MENISNGNSGERLPQNKMMLAEALRSGNIDPEVRPFLKRFFVLPITPTESCYGHPEKGSMPYISYVQDDVYDEQTNANNTRFLTECETQLAGRINAHLKNPWVVIHVETESYGSGPQVHTIHFSIDDCEVYEKHGEVILKTIWEAVLDTIDTYFNTS